MDVDLTIRYSDDRLCEVVGCQLQTTQRFIGSSPAVRTSARALPRRCRKPAASTRSLLGPIGIAATMLKSLRPIFRNRVSRRPAPPPVFRFEEFCTVSPTQILNRLIRAKVGANGGLRADSSVVSTFLNDGSGA